MPRTFLTLTQDEIDLKLAEAIKSRELELLAYDFEQAGHELVVTSIADDWTPELEKYKGLTRDQLIKATNNDKVNAITLKKVADLNHKDKAIHEIEAVKIELAKSEKHYENLLSQLPEERREAAFLALSAKEAQEAGK